MKALVGIPFLAMAVVLALTSNADAGRPAGPNRSGNVYPDEPPRGYWNPGAAVFVDDGTCGQGKIKQVVSASRSNPKRSYSCINWPR